MVYPRLQSDPIDDAYIDLRTTGCVETVWIRYIHKFKPIKFIPEMTINEFLAHLIIYNPYHIGWAAISTGYNFEIHFTFY